MKEIEVQGWVLKCDVETTREAYARIPLGDPEDCGCLYCRNFVAARALAYPAAALSLYEQFGIKADREAETYEAGAVESGLRLYGGWHHFIGRIKKEAGTAVTVAESFDVTFLESGSCAKLVFDGQPLVQVEFFTKVPWLLEEGPEDAE